MNNGLRFRTTVVVSALILGVNAVRAATLAVDVRIPDTQGVIFAYLFDRTGDPLKIQSAIRTATAQVEYHQTLVTFTDIPYGDYAVMVYQDSNRNGQLDRNWLHIPAEPLGFSNEFHLGVWSGLPTFEKLQFAFGPTKQTIRIDFTGR